MLKLRPYKTSDAQTIVSWIGDEVSFRKWCADRYDHYPITADDMNRNYEACTASGGFYPMTAIDENGVVGHLILRYTDELKSVVRFGFIIVDKNKRGMGYGRQMLQEAIKYAFDTLKAQKITLGVFENNDAALQCYRAVGFREADDKNDEYYHIFDEDWKCLELEMKRKQRGLNDEQDNRKRNDPFC